MNSSEKGPAPQRTSTAGKHLTVAFLVGQDNASTRLSIDTVCRLQGVRPRAVLIDTAKSSFRVRLRNLRRNIRREGMSYIGFRAIEAVREILDHWAERIAPRADVGRLLRKAFPESSFSLGDLATRYGFQVIDAGNLNGQFAVASLRELQPDLGIVLGTRILKRSTFAIPRLGSINLHKGKVPEYRGMPPGFWELHLGSDSAGVTVHFVDDRLDTGDIVGTDEIPIHPKETPESLKVKLDTVGARLLATVVASFVEGKETRTVQPPTQQKPWSNPTRKQRLELQRQLPHWRVQSEASQALKTFLYLAIFYCGIYHLVRWARRRQSRAAILLYHRVNDYSLDVLTTTTERFAEHLVVLSRYYTTTRSSVLVDCLIRRDSIQPGTVVIHFDDCYRDVRTYAAPLLRAAGQSGTGFISSGFIDTDRAFAHDVQKYPHVFENLRADDVRSLTEYGLEVGSHTVNHVDLGAVEIEQARVEVFESRRQLEQILERPVLSFSFPFGRLENIREEVRQLVRNAGYHALFSAHGGFVDKSTDPFDIPRFGVSWEHSPLSLLMDLEGLSISQLKEMMARNAAKAVRTLRFRK